MDEQYIRNRITQLREARNISERKMSLDLVTVPAISKA
ncbi:transcriptional regulator [Enterocloster clostridioformis]